MIVHHIYENGIILAIDYMVEIKWSYLTTV